MSPSLALLELFQELKAILKVSPWFPSVFRIWVTFPFDQVLRDSVVLSLVKNSFCFVFVVLFWLIIEACLERCVLVCRLYQ